MIPEPTVPFLDALARAGQLDPSQLDDLRGWADATAAAPPAVAKELTRRGWLTQYQVKEIYKGRAADLTVGKYRVLDLLGEGGMGRVLKARDTRLGRDVALKVIRPEKLSNPTTLDRFRQEIHAAAQLSHPNVVMAFDAEDSPDGRVFLSMEFVDGTDLTKLVQQRGPMPVLAACDAIRQAALGLQHASERGLVHRDVKPSNLLYTPRGQVKVLDLGLALLGRAALPGGDNAHRLTQDGFVLGTPDFLAPEQAQNPTGVDSRADVYGLGATLYYLLTARVPYEGGTPAEKLVRHITEPPPNLLAARPDAPPQLDAVIRWMMAKRPEERPQALAQVAAALAPFCPPQTGVFPAPLSGGPRPIPAVAAVVSHPAAPPDATGHPEPVGYPMSAQPAPPDADPFGGFDPTDDAPPRRRGRDDRDDDRPVKGDRRRVRVKEPKQGGNLPLILIGAGAVLALTCCGVFGWMGYAAVQEAEEAKKPLEAEFANAAGQKMVLVPKGTFRMGSADGEAGREDNEGPVCDVTLTEPFYMAATEVTREQYLQVMGTSPPVGVGSVTDRVAKFLPAAGVSWDQATDFCAKLNRTAAEQNRRKGWAYRLPTEAEWEYAARAGGDGPFAFGGRLVYPKQGAFKLDEDDKYQDTPATAKAVKDRGMALPTGTKDMSFDGDLMREPNKFGLYDLHGNVWEWCQDFYAERHPADPQTDPTGPASAGENWHVARGGAWDETAARCRSAVRKGMAPSATGKQAKEYADVGFRVVFAKLPAKK